MNAIFDLNVTVNEELIRVNYLVFRDFISDSFSVLVNVALCC